MSMVVLTRSRDMRGLGRPAAPVRPNPFPPAQAALDRAIQATGGWDRMALQGFQGPALAGPARGMGALDMETIKPYAPWALGGLAIGVVGVLLLSKKKKRR